jgi:hypothetical protein
MTAARSELVVGTVGLESAEASASAAASSPPPLGEPDLVAPSEGGGLVSSGAGFAVSCGAAVRWSR